MMTQVLSFTSSRVAARVATACAMIIAAGCQPPSLSDDSGSSSSGPVFSSGDIIVANQGSDVVLVLDSEGNYKGVVYDVLNYAETVGGVAWNSTSSEVMVVVDGTDRVVAVNSSGTERDFITNPNLNGTLLGITQLSTGDVLIVESSNVEKFTYDGTRVTTGSWPKALQTTGTGIRGKASGGGFIHCSNGTDVVRVYDASGTQQYTKSSDIPATTDAMDCMEMAGGNVATVWNGTTDTVAIYSSTLAATVASYADATLMASPVGIAQRANGNLLIVDNVYHYIIEITSAGTFVRVIGDDVLNAPRFIMVVP